MRGINMGMRISITIAALSFSIMMFADESSSFSQAGSSGGTIGQQNKSASGSEESPHRSKPVQKAVPHAESRRPKIASSGSITGRWHWDATCTKANFTGLITFVQTGDTFTGEYGHTNFWDSGTISNGRVSGGNVTFDREFNGTDHIALHVSGSAMQGTHDFNVFGHCQIYGTKIR
jgi:hypothetical protein